MNKAPSLKLSPRKERAASIIANGGTQTEAAEKVGVSKQTLTSWAKDKKFQERIEELRTDHLKQADELLEKSVPEAAAFLAALAAGRVSALKCGECDKNLGVQDSKELSLRQKTSTWILDRYKKGKIPLAREGLAEQEAAKEAEMMDEDELDELATRGTPSDE